MPDPEKKKSLLQKAAEFVFIDPKQEPDNRPWDSLTREEQEAVKAAGRKSVLMNERKLSPFTQAVKTATEAVGSLHYKRKPPLVKAPHESWDEFMDQQAENRLFQSVARFPVEQSTPAPSPGETDADILLGIRDARRKGDEERQMTLKEIWERRNPPKDQPQE